MTHQNARICPKNRPSNKTKQRATAATAAASHRTGRVAPWLVPDHHAVNPRPVQIPHHRRVHGGEVAVPEERGHHHRPSGHGGVVPMPPRPESDTASDCKRQSAPISTNQHQSAPGVSMVAR